MNDIFKKIQLYEMLQWANDEKENCINILNSQQFFNGLQKYFSVVILNETQIEKRSLIIKIITMISNSN